MISATTRHNDITSAALAATMTPRLGSLSKSIFYIFDITHFTKLARQLHLNWPEPSET